MQLHKYDVEFLENQLRQAEDSPNLSSTLLVLHHLERLATAVFHHLDRLATAAENIATTTQHISGTYDAIAKTLQGVAASEQPDWEGRTPPQVLEVDVGCWGGISSPCPGPDPVLYVKPKCAVSPLSDTPVVDPDHYA